eukprot:scaffold650_cov140-Skeletonema_menzelii.AAC.9
MLYTILMYRQASASGRHHCLNKLPGPGGMRCFHFEQVQANSKLNASRCHRSTPLNALLFALGLHGTLHTVMKHQLDMYLALHDDGDDISID